MQLKMAIYDQNGEDHGVFSNPSGTTNATSVEKQIGTVQQEGRACSRGNFFGKTEGFVELPGTECEIESILPLQ